MTKKENKEVQTELITYRYLTKRAIKFSIEIVIILVILFYWQDIINLIRTFYGI